MKEFFELIKQNYGLILKLLMILLEVIFFVILLICKKKKKNPAIAFVLLKLPDIISHVEKLGLTGEEKKSLVLSIAQKLWIKEAGSDCPSSVISTISEAIEDILSTPQKKGE